MKNFVSLIAVVLVVLSVPAALFAADDTGSVSASVTIAPVSEMSVTTNINGDTVLDFGTIGSTYDKADDYIIISATSNYGSWKIDIYTDNFNTAPSTGTWGYQYGGLISSANSERVPLGWVATNDPQWIDDAGDPAASRWIYVKDKSDLDDPATPENDSWAVAQGSTTVVAYGGVNFAYATNPNNPDGDDIIYNNTFLVGIETAGDPSNGTYEGNIWFDLYHE